MAFGFFSRLPVIVEPVDAQLSSDVGILPIRQFDDQIGYTQRLVRRRRTRSARSGPD